MTYTISMVWSRQFIEPGFRVSTYLDFGARLFSTQWPPYGAHILQGLIGFHMKHLIKLDLASVFFLSCMLMVPGHWVLMEMVMMKMMVMVMVMVITVSDSVSLQTPSGRARLWIDLGGNGKIESSQIMGRQRATKHTRKNPAVEITIFVHHIL